MKSNKKTTLQQAIQNQERWRQKQITMLYASGRPIFNINNWKQKIEYPVFPQHLLKHYNPTVYPLLR